MKNILLCGYRDWFTKIHSDIVSDEKLNKNFNFLTCKDPDELNKILNENKIDYIFFLGWSWILKKDKKIKSNEFTAYQELATRIDRAL